MNNGLSQQDLLILEELYDHLSREERSFAGYPCNLEFDYSPLYRFLSFSVNNIGDPFLPSNYHVNTHMFERDVLDQFRELTHAPKDGFWGYVTNGGTEGNMYGIYLARELHPQGIVFYSEDTHYSVSKVLRMLNIRNIMIRSTNDGCIDLEDLRETLRIYRDIPPIIFANIGTTMKGAIDDLEGIKGILKEFAIHDYYIHADAALSGMILPFVDDPQPFDFRAGINSISISGHKMIGSPIPCGVVLARKDLVDRIARNVEYIGTMDTTVTGSRNGLSPLFLWYRFKTIGIEGFRKIIGECLEIAEYTVDKLKRNGFDAWRHNNSVTVVFPRPSMEFIRKWQIAVHHKYAHIITMPHIRKPIVDEIIKGLIKDREEAGQRRSNNETDHDHNN